jgi:hypothetical protein
MLTKDIAFSHDRHAKPDALRKGFYKDRSSAWEVEMISGGWVSSYRSIMDERIFRLCLTPFATDTERSSVLEPHSI